MERDFIREVIGASLEVHRALGPGLLESAYRRCLTHELQTLGLRVRREVPVALRYRGLEIDCGYRVDLLVEEVLPVELKAVKALEPIHTAQLLTYLRLLRRPLGLLVNFNVMLLRDGVRRVIDSRR